MAKVKSETKNPSTGSGQVSSRVRQFDKAHCRLRSPQARLGEAILEKLTALEELLKNWESMPSAKDDRPLNFKEACAYLGYAPSYLYKLTYKNVIPHYKPTGKMIFFSKNEVDQWIFSSEERRVKSADASIPLGMTKGDGSTLLTTKDPNQIEMELEEKTERSKKEMDETDASQIHSLNSGQGSAQELLIEFPLKSRRKTLRQAQGDKE